MSNRSVLKLIVVLSLILWWLVSNAPPWFNPWPW
jgi:hypothetical protein